MVLDFSFFMRTQRVQRGHLEARDLVLRVDLTLV